MSEPRSLRPFVEQGLERTLEEIAVGAHRPFPLAGADRVWLVTAGLLELFFVDSGGRRHHLATFETGDLLFGVRSESTPEDRGGGGRLLLAVGHVGTRVAELARADLVRLARSDEGTIQVAAAIDRWLARLTGSIPSGVVPAGDADLVAGSEVAMADGQVGRGRGEVVWLRSVAGRTVLLGDDDFPLTPADGLVPLTRGTWLVARGEGERQRPLVAPWPDEATDTGTGEDGAEPEPETPPPAAVLSAVATPILVRGGAVWGALDRFHDLYRRLVDRELDRRRDTARERLASRRQRDRRRIDEAHMALAAILGRADVLPGPAASPSADLLPALELVASARGLAIEPPPAHEGDPPADLARILEASRIRFRRVILRDDWWRRDGGSLLAFLEPEEQGAPARPVALLQDTPRSYVMVDPATGERRPVDAQVSERLSGRAVMLYRAFPDRPVGLWDLAALALGGRARDLGLVLSMGLAGGVLALLLPLATGQVFGTVVPEADRSLLWQVTAALVVAALASAAFRVTRSFAVLRIGGKTDGRLEPAVWDRLLELPVAFFRRYTVGDLVSRVQGIRTVRQLLTGEVSASILSLVFSLTSFALLFYYSVTLALVACALVGGLFAVSLGLSWAQLGRQRRLQEIEGRMASLILGLIGGISKLRVAGAEGRAYALWARGFAEQRRVTYSVQSLANVQGVVGAVYGVAAMLVLFAVLGLSSELEMPVSDFLAFSAAFGQFQAAALGVLSLVSSVLGAIPSYERLRPILEEPPEVDESKAQAGELAGEIEMSHVSFRYVEDGPLVLDDVSLHARPGEMVALVGPSGSGKSTCLRLILGFESPASGSIYYDSQDLPSLDVKSVRRRIGVVLQNGQPMVGDIFSNIVGSSGLGIGDAWRAAEMAGLADDIRAMPMGMHTVISERAGTFSGGQRQRLLIARAIAQRPRILMFDEATSALDNRTQEIVRQSLEELQVTRIVVAHRLSTIVGADRIYVLDKGRVVESGTYDELLAAGGPFAELARRQLA
jgi:ATP-binding cassette subfamily C protein